MKKPGNVPVHRSSQYAEAEQEYRAACTLDPTNAAYTQNYERLLQRVNQ